MLKSLNYAEVTEFLDEIGNNGDPSGYEREEESGYYQEYKEQFDDLSECAFRLYEAFDNYDYLSNSSLQDIWDDMTVALLGYQEKVLGFDQVEGDYFAMLSYDENAAVKEAEKRLMRFTKEQLIRNFRKVLTSLVLFFDIKAAHDCLISIVQELDERGAVFNAKNQQIDRLYEDLTGKNSKEFDEIISNLPQRMWVE